MTTEHELIKRITVRADVFGGKPIIRDMRIAVEHVLAMLVAGETQETVLREYPSSRMRTYRLACSSPTAR